VEFKDSAYQSLTINVDSRPVSVILDSKSAWMIEWDFNPSSELLKYVLKNSTSVRHRIWAVRKLILRGDKGYMTFVKNTLNDEKFYGVHLEAVNALGDSSSEHSLEILADMLNYITNHRVLTAIVKNLKENNSLSKILLISFLERDDISYYSRAAALESLGRQDFDDEVYNIIVKNIDEFKNVGLEPIVVNGALVGLKNTKSKKSFDYLYQSLDYGVLPEFSRPTAIISLAEIANYMDKRDKLLATEKIKTLLREPFKHIKLAVVDAMVVLRAVECIPAIESILNLLSNQDQDRVIRKISQITHPSEEELKKEINNLSIKVKELERKIKK